MKLIPFAFAILLGLTSCTSESSDGRFKSSKRTEKVKDQVNPDTKASIDSVARTSSRGDIVFPVPDTLTRLLSQERPNAKIPPFPDQVITDKRFQVNNPLYLTGDFNGDKNRDYAVQVMDKDSIHMLAYLDYAGQAKEVKIATYAAQKLKQGYYTLYKLKLAPKDSVVIDYKTQKPKPLSTDGVVIMQEARSSLYLLQNGRFLPVQQKN